MTTERGESQQPATEGEAVLTAQPNEARRASDTTKVAEDEVRTDVFVPIPIPENASLEAQLNIMRKNNSTFWAKTTKRFEEQRRMSNNLIMKVRLEMEHNTELLQGHIDHKSLQAQEQHEQLVTLINAQAAQTKVILTEIAAIRSDGSDTVIQVAMQKAEMDQTREVLNKVLGDPNVILGSLGQPTGSGKYIPPNA